MKSSSSLTMQGSSENSITYSNSKLAASFRFRTRRYHDMEKNIKRTLTSVTSDPLVTLGISLFRLDNNLEFDLKTGLTMLEKHVQSELENVVSTNNQRLEHCTTCMRWANQAVLSSLVDAVTTSINEFRATSIAERLNEFQERKEDLITDI